MGARYRADNRVTTSQDIYIDLKNITNGDILTYNYKNTRFEDMSIVDALSTFVTVNDWNNILAGLNLSTGGTGGGVDLSRYVTIDTEQTITGKKTFDEDILGKKNVVAFYTGNYDITSPLATTGSVGLASFDSEYFTVTNGKVSIKTDSGGSPSIGNEYFAGMGLFLDTQIKPNDRFNVLFSNVANSSMRGDTKIWGQIASDNYVIDGAITINDKLIIRESELARYNLEILGKETQEIDTVFHGNLHATMNIVAYSTGNYTITQPIATANSLGFIKVGSGLTISADGTLSSSGEGSFNNITTIGTGNALTRVTVNDTNSGLIFYKDNTFLTYNDRIANADYATNAGTASTANSIPTRTLWGQSFNGTANVTGSLSSANGLTPSSNGTYNIGTSSLRYNNGYFSAAIYSNSSYLNNDTLFIQGNGNPLILFGYGGSSSFTSRIQGGANNSVQILSRCSIGNTAVANSSYSLYVTGASYFTGNVLSAGNITAYYTGTSSDKRLKEIIKLNEEKDVIDKYSKLSLYHYKYNDRPEEKIGLIAQELQDVNNYHVYDRGDGYLSIAYGELAVQLVIQSFKELVQWKKDNEQLIKNLKEEINQLKKK